MAHNQARALTSERPMYATARFTLLESRTEQVAPPTGDHPGNWSWIIRQRILAHRYSPSGEQTIATPDCLLKCARCAGKLLAVDLGERSVCRAFQRAASCLRRHQPADGHFLALGRNESVALVCAICAILPALAPTA